MLFLFDFDLTLVSAKGRVPLQTHKLVKRLLSLGHAFGIVTNNIMAPSMCSELGLPPHRIVVSFKNELRADLIRRWFDHFTDGVPTPFVYFDDLFDQLQDVKKVFGDTCMGIYHIEDEQQLFRSIEECLKKSLH